jgi:hypothetical protein
MKYMSQHNMLNNYRHANGTGQEREVHSMIVHLWERYNVLMMIIEQRIVMQFLPLVRW